MGVGNIKNGRIVSFSGPSGGGSTTPTTKYIYPFGNMAHSHNWANPAGHDVLASWDDDDPTLDDLNAGATVARSIKWEFNDDDDDDTQTWRFYIPNDFNQFVGDLEIDVFSSDFSETDFEISMIVNGTVDATINASDINPTADGTWETMSIAYGGNYNENNRNQLVEIRITATGDTGLVVRADRLCLAYQ